MFKNCGRKIKVLAIIFFWIGVVASVLIALGIIFGGQFFLSLLVQNANAQTPALTQNLSIDTTGSIIIGVVVAVVGILSTWLSSLFVYGFGELIDNTSRMSRRLGRLNKRED